MDIINFNPFHNHHGHYSFVIWLDIPTDYREQYATTEANKVRSRNDDNI